MNVTVSNKWLPCVDKTIHDIHVFCINSVYSVLIANCITLKKKKNIPSMIGDDIKSENKFVYREHEYDH